MDSLIIEIKAAEGGADSRLLVTDMLEIYVAAASRRRV
jgi:protein subunit release factor A